MAVKTYKYTDTTQITEHFRASEFRCKCGKTHDFNVDDELVEKLEALRAALECSSITVASGFRCVAHDKAVGGTGTGQHTLGKAADITCYDKDGKVIDTKLVCCAAQDIGFSGIARINDRNTHVDVRSGKTWKGDETKGNSYCIPYSDFYEYFHIEKPASPQVTEGVEIELAIGGKRYKGTVYPQ